MKNKSQSNDCGGFAFLLNCWNLFDPDISGLNGVSQDNAEAYLEWE